MTDFTVHSRVVNSNVLLKRWSVIRDKIQRTLISGMNLSAPKYLVTTCNMDAYAHQKLRRKTSEVEDFPEIHFHRTIAPLQISQDLFVTLYVLIL